jgi:hypothetical protein
MAFISMLSISKPAKFGRTRTVRDAVVDAGLIPTHPAQVLPGTDNM